MTAWSIVRRLALLALNASLAFLLWQEVTRPQVASEERVSATRSIALDPVVGPAGRQATAAVEAPARDLFASADPPPPPPPPEPMAAPPIILVGTALGETNFALVRLSPDTPAARVKEGTAIGDWLLASVRRNAIVVVRDQKRWRIGFAPAQPVECATPACAD